MENINQIKLNIWGIRGGFRCFCHSGDLDVEEPGINNTWKDIRNFVYVSDLNVRFYALEFAPSYKVYTIYRPVNDTSRTGAYVATTLYVPHCLRVNRILDLLKQISDAYHRDHYDAFGNPNNNPDYVQVYLDIIKNYAANIECESKNRSWPVSKQDNTPKILPYNDIGVVERFFAEPYRVEFLDSQEVMFWDNNCLQNMQTYGIKFQRVESLNEGNQYKLNGEGVKEQFNGGKIINQPIGYDVVNFKLNDNELGNGWPSTFFEDKDEIEISLSKPYHETMVYRGTMIGVGSPFVKRGTTDYAFSSSVMFSPRKYNVQIVVPENLADQPFNLYANNTLVSINNGKGNFTFAGDKLDSLVKIDLRYDNATFPVQEIKPRDLLADGIGAGGALFLRVDNLKRVRFEFGKPTRGVVSLGRMRWSFDTLGDTFYEIVLPSNLMIEAKLLAFEVNEHQAKIETLDATTFKVTLTSQFFYVRVDVDEGLKRFIDPRYFIFNLKVNGGSFSADREFRFRLLESTRNLMKKKDGTLSVVANGIPVPCRYNVVSENEVGEIILKPDLAVYSNDTESLVTLGSERGVAVKIGSKQDMVLPSINWIAKDDKGFKDGLEMTEGSSSGGCRQFHIQRKFSSSKPDVNRSGNSSGVHPSSNNSQSGNVVSEYGNPVNNTSEVPRKENKVKNDYLCYYYGENVRPYALTGIPRQLKDYNYYTIKNLEEGRDLVLCFHFNNTPFLERTQEQSNEANGFDVSLNEQGYYVVKDTLRNAPRNKKGGSKGKEDDKAGKKKGIVIISCTVACLLLVVGLLIWKPWGGGKKAKYVIKIEMKNETSIEAVDLNLSPKSDLAQLKFKQNEKVAYIDLFNGWNKLDFVVKTQNEGNIAKIELKEVENSLKPQFSPLSIRNQDKGDTLIISLVSPAWDSLEVIQDSAISRYARLAEKFPSQSFTKACVNKAYAFVKESSDTLVLLKFVEKFDKIEESCCERDTINEKLSGLRAEEKEKAKQQSNLDDFESKLRIVYSINCTKKDVKSLEAAYNKVKDYDKDDLIASMRKAGLNPLDDDGFIFLIRLQEGFFDIFDLNFVAAHKKIKNYYLIYSPSRIQKEQADCMRQLIETEDVFNYYKDHLSQCKDGKYYIYIIKYYKDAVEGEGADNTETRTSSETSMQTEKQKNQIVAKEKKQK